MTDTRFEELVALFLDRREDEPDLAPEAFADEHPDVRDELLSAIRAALSISDVLHGAGTDAPREIGPYRVLGELGRGGMGIVYTVERDGERRALKLLSTQLPSPRALERFAREARTLARLEHPGIVRILDSGTYRGSPYLVMELVEGVLLSRLPAPLAPDEAARIVRSLAQAVHAAHEAGVLHRDLKPQNVILREDGAPVLLDFGLVASEEEGSLTATGALLGTPRYLAPERAAGKPADRRTDVHGLGLILYELLYGMPARPDATRDAILAFIARERLRPPGESRERVPRALENITLAAGARNPRRRPASAQLLARELERHLAGERVRIRPPRTWELALDTLVEKPVRSASWALVALLVLVLARQRGEPSLSAAEERQLAIHVDAAYCAWLHGTEPVARAALERARDIDADDPRIRIIAAAVSGSPLPVELESKDLDGLARGLELLQSARFGEASARLEPCAESSASAAALRLRGLRRSGSSEAALAAGRDAHARFPRSSAVSGELASLLVEEGETEQAESVLAAALEASPDSAPLSADHARVLTKLGRHEEAFERAIRAADLAGANGGDATLELPRLLAETPEAPRLLRARIEGGEERSMLWFALAYALDSRHELEGAAEAYSRALELEPDLYRACINLAHLHAGAQLGSCEQCDAAYARAPGMLAPQRALEELRRALFIDRGRSETGIGRVVQTALALQGRAPDSDSLGAVEASLQELLALSDISMAARSRIEEGRSLLKAAAGRSAD